MSSHPGKPKRRKRRLLKLGIDEISLVDRPMVEPARVAILKRVNQVLKRIALTTATDGHSHSIITDFQGGEARLGSTSWVDDHSHDWVMDDSGDITIGEADDHTHEIGVLVMKGDPDDNDKLLGELEKRANENIPDGASTGDGATGDHTDNPSSEEITMTEKKEGAAEGKDQAVTQENEDLKKRLERSESINKLSAGQREHFAKLAEDKQDEFLAQSSDERDQEIKEAQEADKIVFKSADGDVYRQSDDPRLVKMAREREKDHKETAELKKTNADMALRKRATEEMKNLPGTVEVKMSILKSIDKLPEAEQKPALEALQARNAEMADAFTTVGRSVEAGEEGATPSQQLDSLAKARAKEKDISEEVAYGEVLKTTEGEALYKRHVEQTAG